MHQFLEPLYHRDPILHEIYVRQLRQVRDVFDMLDLVETQIEAGQVDQIVETFDVADKVVI